MLDALQVTDTKWLIFDPEDESVPVVAFYGWAGMTKEEVLEEYAKAL